MKEWFKARNIWGAAIETLSDAEAGRLMKALWHYTMTGELLTLSGAEKGIFALILMTLSQDEERESEISEKRASAGSLGGKQRIANASKSKQMQANDFDDEANQANALIRNKSQNKNKEQEKEKDKEKEIRRFTPPTLQDVQDYCRERGNKVNPERFIDFYASKGWKVGNQPMKDWKACVRTWEQRDNNTVPVKQVVAQQYEQREYTGSENPDDILDRIDRIANGAKAG